MKRAYADTLHGQIHYRTEGSGEPILLLHMTPLSSMEWEKAIPFLAEKYCAVAMDTIGYGESDKPPRPYELSDYARSVIDFIDALGIEKVSIGGHHTGASIAGEVAAAYTERVDKVLLANYPLYTPEERAERLRGTPAYLQPIVPFELKEDGSHMMAAWNWAKETRRQPMSLEDWQSVAMGILKGGSGNIEGFLALWRYDAQARLPLIKSPTLVLNSAGDRFAARGSDLVKLIPRSREVVIESANYLPRNDPEKFARAVMDFMQKPSV